MAPLVRYEKRTGEELVIQPQEAKGEPPLRWNWDSPLIDQSAPIPFLYFGANKLFRSDDRGNTWKAAQRRPDSADRSQPLPVMAESGAGCGA